MFAARRLILIEGLPNIGKTTTAENLAAALDATVWHEYDPDNPIALGWPVDAANVIRSCVSARYPFHDWEALVEQAPDGVQIVEARFCQNAACFALLAGDDEDTAVSVSVRIAEIVAPLRPLVVHLRAPDADAHAAMVPTKFTVASRDFLFGTFDQQRWLTDRGLGGEAGFVAAIRSWADLNDRVMAEVTAVPGIDVLVVDDPAADWPATRARVTAAARSENNQA